MRVKVRYLDEADAVVWIDSRRYELDELQPYNFTEILEEYSKVVAELSRVLYVGGINYAYLINYFLLWSSPYFSSPGLDIIMAYLHLLDKHVKEDVELEANEQYANTFKQCARLVCKKKGFRLKLIREEYPKKRFDFLYNTPFFVRNLLRARLGVRFILGLVRGLAGKHDNNKADVLMLTNLRFSGHDEHDNTIFGEVYKQLEKRLKCKPIRYEVLIQTQKLVRFIKEFMWEPVAYIGDYYSIRHFLNNECDFKALRRVWNIIKNKPELKQIFSYKGYNYYNIFKPRLEMVFNAMAIISADTKNIAETITSKEKQKVLLLDHEENMYGKGFMLVNRNKPTATVALAYEIIHSGTIHTFVKNKELQDKGSRWRPLPDIKCVWGEYAKRILVENCNYPEQIIELTGNPSYDLLLNHNFSTSQILKKYNLSGKPKLLFASTRADRGIFRGLKKLAKENQGLEVIYKPHPNEDPNAVKQFFKRMPKNLRIAPKYAPIHELIYVSDYVMTSGSTVGFEAMLMGKPVFVLNLRRLKLGGLPYVEASTEIYSIGEFSNALKQLDEKAMKARAKKFINEFHISDGKAAERVAELIFQKLYKRDQFN